MVGIPRSRFPIVTDICSFDGYDIWYEAEEPEDLLSEDEWVEMQETVIQLTKRANRLMEETEEDYEAWLRDALTDYNTGIHYGRRM